jgi:hypothetical protein
MNTRFRSRRLSLLVGSAAIAAIAALVFSLAPGCKPGGDEGSKCNPLVLRNECNDGLSCKAFDCSESFCCPVNGTSSDPHCNGEGCPDTDGGEEGGAQEGGADAGADVALADSGVDANDAGPDAADASDGS